MNALWYSFALLVHVQIVHNWWMWKEKANQRTFVEDFLHFAVQEYTALLYGFYKQNYVFGKCL